MNPIKLFREKLKTYDDAHNFTCDICGREVFANERVCAACDKALPRIGEIYCPFCGRRGREPGACLQCKERPLGVKKARSAFVHEDEAARLIVRFKRGERYLWRTLVEYALPLLGEFDACDAIVCVPMTQTAEKKRGYNHSRVLAEAIAERSGIPFLDALEKRRGTSSQKMLGRREREKNLERSFRVTDRAAVKGKRVLIVDDALTTGATVSEIAAVLKRAGAAEVFALTITSVENKYPFGFPENSK